MRKSSVEYADYVWSPIRRVQDRKATFSMKLSEHELNYPQRMKQKDKDDHFRILLNPEVDIFHRDIGIQWRSAILDAIAKADQHVFIVKTKHAFHVEDVFLINLWLGITITGKFNIDDNERRFRKFQEDVGCFMKFLSLDPLKTESCWSLSSFEWVIIGAGRKPVQKNWIREYRDRCAVLGIPIFMRNSLKDTWGKDLIQQYPFKASDYFNQPVEELLFDKADEEEKIESPVEEDN